jgi:hypothetical protein
VAEDDGPGCEGGITKGGGAKDGVGHGVRVGGGSEGVGMDGGGSTGGAFGMDGGGSTSVALTVPGKGSWHAVASDTI